MLLGAQRSSIFVLHDFNNSDRDTKIVGRAPILTSRSASAFPQRDLFIFIHFFFKEEKEKALPSTRSHARFNMTILDFTP